MAIRLLSLLFEGALVQLLQAEGTDEMLWVKLFPHGGDASSGDRFLAAGAQRPSPRVIMNLAIGLTVVFEVASTGEGHETFSATEAFIVPLALEG